MIVGTIAYLTGSRSTPLRPSLLCGRSRARVEHGDEGDESAARRRVLSVRVLAAGRDKSTVGRIGEGRDLPVVHWRGTASRFGTGAGAGAGADGARGHRSR